MLVAVSAASIISCSTERDAFLRSLPLEAQHLEAVDSFNIDRYGLYQPNSVVKSDNGWIVLSSAKGRYKLLFFNPDTGDHFPVVHNGRGPGEIIQGGSLHGDGKTAVYYDLNSATCIKIHLNETVRSRKVVADTIGNFKGVSKPVFLTSAGSGFISGNLTDAGVWYSYYDSKGNIVSNVDALEFNDLPAGGDYAVSFLISSRYASSPDGRKVCVATVGAPALSFSEIENGNLTEYKRYTMDPVGMENGRLTPDHVSAFAGMDADEDYVYVIYSGHKIRGDVFPADECRHLIIYDWDGNPVRHYRLDRNINSIDVADGCLYGASNYPESAVYKFDLSDLYR